MCRKSSSKNLINLPLRSILQRTQRLVVLPACGSRALKPRRGPAPGLILVKPDEHARPFGLRPRQKAAEVRGRAAEAAASTTVASAFRYPRGDAPQGEKLQLGLGVWLRKVLIVQHPKSPLHKTMPVERDACGPR